MWRMAVLYSVKSSDVKLFQNSDALSPPSKPTSYVYTLGSWKQEEKSENIQ